jgi:acyl-coenzyme A thioesterase PaaI-like protein
LASGVTSHVHAWEDDGWCYLCGARNPEGLHLSFTLDGDEIETRFVAERRHQGYRDVLHGGMLAMVLDEVMVMLPYRRFGTVTANAEFSVRLHAPVATGTGLRVRARFTGAARAGQRMFRVAAEARREDGTLVASGEGACVRVR